MLRHGWWSVRDNFVRPARGCGYDVDVFIAMHRNARNRMPDEYVARLQAIDNSTELWVSAPDLEDQQFTTVVSFLDFLAPRASTYALVIMTRDDFVYDDGSWDILASHYDRSTLNLVSDDCAHHKWDGLHVFPGADVTIFRQAIAENVDYPHWAHSIDYQTALSVRPLNTWFQGNYGQPDECKPAMGYLDRGEGNGIVERLGNGIFDDARRQGACCAEPWKEFNDLRNPNMATLRSCPVL